MNIDEKPDVSNRQSTTNRLERELQQKQSVIAEQKKELEALSSHIQHLEEQIMSHKKSFWWQVTKPMRFLSDWIKKSVIVRVHSFLRFRSSPEEMTLTQKLNPYLDYSNYERATHVVEHKRKFTKAKSYKEGLSIIILNLNKPELIIPLIESLIKAKKKFKEINYDVEIIVGDTGSRNKEVLTAYKKMSSDIILRENMKYHFSSCNNTLFYEQAAYSKILFLNNDVIFGDAFESIKMMIENNEDESTGITGQYLFYPDGSVQHMGVDFFKTGEYTGFCYHPKHREHIDIPSAGYSSIVPSVTGACLMIKSSLFYDTDGFDEDYSEEVQDVALCLSLKRLGFNSSIVYTGNVIHLENATRPKGSENWKDRRRFLRKWKSFVEVL